MPFNYGTLFELFKKKNMKIYLFTSLIMIGALSAGAQANKTEVLQSLEANQANSQVNTPTAKVKTSTRLFKSKEDLTSVIMIIPSGAVVAVLDADSTYYHVTYEENEGYIFRKHAVPDKAPATFSELNSAGIPAASQPQAQSDSRYDELESKYGSAMAARIYAGKIWKGMNSEMVHDSWGAARKINRVVSGNVIKEEWIYNSTWLYFENNSLIQWGPVRR
jgi:hypothetical protein